jgi:uncharacterized membrane protein YtjA (UPF0391 family)
MPRRAALLASDVPLKSFANEPHFHSPQNNSPQRSITMLYWALVFLIVALVAAVFGFTGVYAAAAGIAQILFFIFLVLFLVSLVAGGWRGRRPMI